MVCNISGMESLTNIVGNFHGLIANSLPQIICLLKDDNESVREASVEVLSKLSRHGM